jgi:coproporphyrinogen III oxidase
MTSIAPTQCRACAHFSPELGAGCRAFPKGRPDSIRFFGADHRNPVRGDGGLVFQKSHENGADAAFADWEKTFER